MEVIFPFIVTCPTVRVKKGSLVRARDVLGEIHTNAEGETILHFQLRKER